MSTNVGATASAESRGEARRGITSGRSRPSRLGTATEFRDTLTYLVCRRQEAFGFLQETRQIALGLLAPAAAVLGEEHVAGSHARQRADDAAGNQHIPFVHDPSASRDTKPEASSLGSRLARAARPGSSMLCLRILL